jgi:hypothetical protein
MLKALLFALLPAALAPVPRPRAAESAPVQTRPRPRPRNYGARADSLNGIPGHAFGEPRSSFPELAAKGYQDLEGYTYYEAKEGQEPGWFGKNAGHVRTIYRFYQDKFAAFDASAQGTDRPLLAEEAVYLLGKGLPEPPKNLAYGEAAVNWEGQRVRATLSDGHNECRLVIRSKLAAAQKAAAEAAQKKAEAAARAAKLRMDNAPAAH